MFPILPVHEECGPRQSKPDRAGELGLLNYETSLCSPDPSPRGDKPLRFQARSSSRSEEAGRNETDIAVISAFFSHASATLNRAILLVLSLS